MVAVPSLFDSYILRSRVCIVFALVAVLNWTFFVFYETVCKLICLESNAFLCDICVVLEFVSLSCQGCKVGGEMPKQAEMNLVVPVGTNQYFKRLYSGRIMNITRAVYVCSRNQSFFLHL
ncbi:unnamed protein product [Choristocarpus tenellus]